MGKGDWRRPTLEKDEQVTQSWCETFGHRRSAHGEWCVNCGATFTYTDLGCTKGSAPHADAVGES